MQEFFYTSKNIFYRKNEWQTNRPTLVFVHGLSGSSAAWLPYENKFENKYNILTFDLRGHGKSKKWKNYEDYAIKKFAEDLYELVFFLNINKFILVSHSFGVLIALEFISSHQDMIEQIVFLSPSFAPNRILPARIIRPLLNLSHLFKFLPFDETGRGQVDYSRFKNTGDWNIPRMMTDIKETSWRVYLYGTKQSYEVDYEKLLEQINLPTLIMHGRRDTIFPVKHSYVMRDKIKNSQLIILDNSNHILVLNNFSEVSEAIEEFVSGK